MNADNVEPIRLGDVWQRCTGEMFSPVPNACHKRRTMLDEFVVKVWCCLQSLSDYRNGEALTKADFDLWERVAQHPAVLRVLDRTLDESLEREDTCGTYRGDTCQCVSVPTGSTG